MPGCPLPTGALGWFGEGAEILTRLSGRRVAANRAARVDRGCHRQEGMKVHQGPLGTRSDGEPLPWPGSPEERGLVRCQKRSEAERRWESGTERPQLWNPAEAAQPQAGLPGRSTRGVRTKRTSAPWRGIARPRRLQARRTSGRAVVLASPGSRSRADGLLQGHGHAPEAQPHPHPRGHRRARQLTGRARGPLRHRVLQCPARVRVLCRRGRACPPQSSSPARGGGQHQVGLDAPHQATTAPARLRSGSPPSGTGHPDGEGRGLLRQALGRRVERCWRNGAWLHRIQPVAALRTWSGPSAAGQGKPTLAVTGVSVAAGRCSSRSRRQLGRSAGLSRRLGRPDGSQCKPHSLTTSCSHHQRPARGSSPGWTGRVQGAQPIEG
jgi:hypothetical protein